MDVGLVNQRVAYVVAFGFCPRARGFFDISSVFPITHQCCHVQVLEKPFKKQQITLHIKNNGIVRNLRCCIIIRYQSWCLVVDTPCHQVLRSFLGQFLDYHWQSSLSARYAPWLTFVSTAGIMKSHKSPSHQACKLCVCVPTNHQHPMRTYWQLQHAL